MNCSFLKESPYFQLVLPGFYLQLLSPVSVTVSSTGLKTLLLFGISLGDMYTELQLCLSTFFLVN